ncbi:MAG: hypothetical protein EOP88_16910 [Verrucomicrobiaceae bacterium]|jgi:hypothetical protein|nr:MAG: hypothetical protein EOP88_16910 [Verrucomicrobiaceae bacterium]
MNEKSTTYPLLEPVSPETLVPHSWVEPWMIWLAAIAFILSLALVWFLTRKKPVAPDPRLAREAARAEAAAALDRIGEVPAREAAVVSSLVLRKYLATAAGDPALFETHEEYIGRHEALKDFSEEARGATSIGFARLAAIKYSQDDPDMETPQVVAGSHNLLGILHTGLRA